MTIIPQNGPINKVRDLEPRKHNKTPELRHRLRESLYHINLFRAAMEATSMPLFALAPSAIGSAMPLIGSASAIPVARPVSVAP